MAKFKMEVIETNRAFFIVDAENAEQARTLWHAVIAGQNCDRIIEELSDGYEGAELVGITPAGDDDLEYYTELDAGEER